MTRARPSNFDLISQNQLKQLDLISKRKTLQTSQLTTPNPFDSTSFQELPRMSYEPSLASTANSSFLSQEDTFLNARRRAGLPSLGGTATAHNSSNSRLLQHQLNKPSANGNTSGYIPPMSNISSYTPIKPLVDSPFKSPLATNPRPPIRSTPLTFTNGTETNLSHSFITSSPAINDRGRLMTTPPTSLLKDKVKQQQSKYYTPSSTTPQLNANIHQSSIFRSRRGLNTPYPSGNFQLNETHKVQKQQEVPTMTMKQESSLVPPSSEGNTATDLDSPYVELALKRIINKDQETRKLLINLFLVLLYKFLKALVQLFLANLQLHKIVMISNNSKVYQYGSYIDHILYFILSFNIIFSLIRLLKPNDKCLDLPLTDKQRKLLGLPILSTYSSSSTDYTEDYVPNSTKTQQKASTISSLDKPTIIKPTSEPIRLSDTSLKSIQHGRDTSFAALDISRSFAGMKLGSITTPYNPVQQQEQLSNYNRSSLTSLTQPRQEQQAMASLGPSSPDKIKERLIQSRKSISNISIAGGNTNIGSPMGAGAANRSMFDDTRIKRPSSKFLYDVKNGAGEVSGYYSGDLSYY